MLQFQQPFGRKHCRQTFAVHAVRVPQNLSLCFPIRIADPDAHQKAVQLAFRKRIGAVMLHRVLRGHHHERLLQRIGVTLNGHLHFVHGLEQRRLRLRRSSVDLVRQKEIGEDRALLELEVLRMRVVYGYAQNVARQHVAGELQAVKTAMHRARQRLR